MVLAWVAEDGQCTCDRSTARRVAGSLRQSADRPSAVTAKFRFSTDVIIAILTSHLGVAIDSLSWNTVRPELIMACYAEDAIQRSNRSVKLEQRRKAKHESRQGTSVKQEQDQRKDSNAPPRAPQQSGQQQQRTRHVSDYDAIDKDIVAAMLIISLTKVDQLRAKLQHVARLKEQWKKLAHKVRCKWLAVRPAHRKRKRCHRADQYHLGIEVKLGAG